MAGSSQDHKLLNRVKSLLVRKEALSLEQLREEYRTSKQMETMVVEFGQKMKGKTFLEVMQNPKYLLWFVSHCDPPVGAGQMKLFRYVELLVEEAEAESEEFLTVLGVMKKNEVIKVKEEQSLKGPPVKVLPEPVQEFQLCDPVEMLEPELHLLLTEQTEEIIRLLQVQQKQGQVMEVRLKRIETVLEELMKRLHLWGQKVEDGRDEFHKLVSRSL